MVCTVTMFDLFRTNQSVDKATFTVGDMLSREQVMTPAKLDGMMTLVRNMVPSAGQGGLRISNIIKSGGKLQVRWSEKTGSSVPSTALDASVIPDIAEGDSVLLTESFVPHQALVDWFGLDLVTFNAKVAHRPRFVSEIKFQK